VNRDPLAPGNAIDDLIAVIAQIPYADFGYGCNVYHAGYENLLHVRFVGDWACWAHQVHS